MRVLGLDPGLTCAGYGLVERKDGRIRAVDFGAIRTARGAVPGRLAALHDALVLLMEKHRPDAVAVERVLFNANARTAMSVGQAAGIALLVAEQAGCEIAEYTANEVKQAITGYGQADKKQVAMMVGRLLDLDAPPTPADAADALGLAITHAAARKLRRLAQGA